MLKSLRFYFIALLLSISLSSCTTKAVLITAGVFIAPEICLEVLETIRYHPIDVSHRSRVSNFANKQLELQKDLWLCQETSKKWVITDELSEFQIKVLEEHSLHYERLKKGSYIYMSEIFALENCYCSNYDHLEFYAWLRREDGSQLSHINISSFFEKHCSSSGDYYRLNSAFLKITGN